METKLVKCRGCDIECKRKSMYRVIQLKDFAVRLFCHELCWLAHKASYHDNWVAEDWLEENPWMVTRASKEKFFAEYCQEAQDD